MIIERIARYADLDTRRALGIFERLPRAEFVLRPEIWRYWPTHQRAIYFNPCPENNDYEFEVHTGLVFADEFWTYTPNAQVRTTFKRKGRYVYQEHSPREGTHFDFACRPEFMS